MFQSISEIVHRAISPIKSYHTISKTDEHLVILTWLMESGLEESFHKGNPNKHGYMRLTKDQFRVLLYDHIRIHPKMCDDILAVSLIDVRTARFSDMYDALMYNVAFQAIVTWCYYRIHLNEMPRSIESAVNVYYDQWKKQSIVDSEDVEDAAAMLIDWLDEMGS